MEDEEIHKATSQCSSNDKNRRANKKRSALNNTTRNGSLKKITKREVPRLEL